MQKPQVIVGVRTPYHDVPMTGTTQTNPSPFSKNSITLPVKNSAHQPIGDHTFRPGEAVLSVSPSSVIQGWRESKSEAAKVDPGYNPEMSKILPKECSLLMTLFLEGKVDARKVRREDFYMPFPTDTDKSLEERLWELCKEAFDEDTKEDSLGVQEGVCMSWLRGCMTNFLGRTPQIATNAGLNPWKEGREEMDKLYKIGRSEGREAVKMIETRSEYHKKKMYKGSFGLIKGVWEWRAPRKQGKSFFDTVATVKGIGSSVARQAKAEIMTAMDGFCTKLVDFGSDLPYDSVELPDGSHIKTYYPRSLLQLSCIVNMMFTSHYVLLSGNNLQWDIDKLPNFGDKICFDIKRAETQSFDPVELPLNPASANCVRKTISSRDVEAAYSGVKQLWMDQDEGILGHEFYDQFLANQDFAAQMAEPIPIQLPDAINSVDLKEHPNFLGFWLHQAYLYSSICASGGMYGVGRRTAVRTLSSTDALVTMVDHRASGQQKQGEPFRWCLLRKTGMMENEYEVVQQCKTTRAMAEGELDVIRNMCFYSYTCNALSTQFIFAHGVSLTNSNMLKTAAELSSNNTDSTAQLGKGECFRNLVVKKTDEKGPTNAIEAALLNVLIYAQRKACPCSLFWNKVIPPQSRSSLLSFFRACEKSFKHQIQNQQWAREHGIRKDANQYHMDAIDSFIPEFVEQFVNPVVTKRGVSQLSKIALGDLMTLKKSVGFDETTLKAHPVICALNILQCLSEWEKDKSTAIATLNDMIPFLMEHYPEFMQTSYTFAKDQDTGERPIEEMDFFFRMLLTALLLLIRGVASGQTIDLASNPGAKQMAMGEAASLFERARSCLLAHVDVTAFCMSMPADFCSKVVTMMTAKVFGEDSNIVKTINTLLAQVKSKTRTVSRDQVLPAMGIWVCQNGDFADPKKAAHYISNWKRTPYAVCMCGMRFVDLELLYEDKYKPNIDFLTSYFVLDRLTGNVKGVENPWRLKISYDPDYIRFYETFWKDSVFSHPYTFRVTERELPFSDVMFKKEEGEVREQICKQQVQIFLSTGTYEGQDMYAESLATSIMIAYVLTKRMGFKLGSYRLMVTSDDIYVAIAKEANPTETSCTANLGASELLTAFNQLMSEVGVNVSLQKTGITVKTIDNDKFTALIFNSQLWATSIDGVSHGSLLKCLARSFRELMYNPTGHCSSFANCLRIIQKFAIDHKFLTDEEVLLINKGQFLTTMINNGGMLYYGTILHSRDIEMAVGCPLLRSIKEIRQDPFGLLIEHLQRRAFNYITFKRGRPEFTDTQYKTHLEAEQYSSLARVSMNQTHPTALTVAGLMLAIKQLNKEDSDDLSFPLKVAYHWGNCYRGLYSQLDIEDILIKVDVSILPPPFLQIYRKEIVVNSDSDYMYFYYTGSALSPNRPDETAVLSWMDLSVTEGRANKGMAGDIISGHTLADMAFEMTNYTEPECHCIMATPVGTVQTLAPVLSSLPSNPEELLENQVGPRLILMAPYPVITYSPTGIGILRTHTGKVVVTRDSVAVAALRFKRLGDKVQLQSCSLTPCEKLFVSPYINKFDFGVHLGILDNVCCSRRGLNYVIGLYQGEDMKSSIYSCAQLVKLMKNNLSCYFALNFNRQTMSTLLVGATSNRGLSDETPLLLSAHLPRSRLASAPSVTQRDPSIQEAMIDKAVGFICREGVTVGPCDDVDLLVRELNEHKLQVDSLVIQEDEGRDQMVLTVTNPATQEQQIYMCQHAEEIRPCKPPVQSLNPRRSARGLFAVMNVLDQSPDEAVPIKNSKQVAKAAKLPEGRPEYKSIGPVSMVSVNMEKARPISYVKQSSTKDKSLEDHRLEKVTFGSLLRQGQTAEQMREEYARLEEERKRKKQSKKSSTHPKEEKPSVQEKTPPLQESRSSSESTRIESATEEVIEDHLSTTETNAVEIDGTVESSDVPKGDLQVTETSQASQLSNTTKEWSPQNPKKNVDPSLVGKEVPGRISHGDDEIWYQLYEEEASAIDSCPQAFKELRKYDTTAKERITGYSLLGSLVSVEPSSISRRFYTDVFVKINDQFRPGQQRMIITRPPDGKGSSFLERECKKVKGGYLIALMPVEIHDKLFEDGSDFSNPTDVYDPVRIKGTLVDLVNPNRARLRHNGDVSIFNGVRWTTLTDHDKLGVKVLKRCRETIEFEGKTDAFIAPYTQIKVRPIRGQEITIPMYHNNSKTCYEIALAQMWQATGGQVVVPRDYEKEILGTCLDDAYFYLDEKGLMNISLFEKWYEAPITKASSQELEALTMAIVGIEGHFFMAVHTIDGWYRTDAEYKGELYPLRYTDMQPDVEGKVSICAIPSF